MVLHTAHYMVQDYKKGTKMKLSTVVNTIVLTVIFYFSGLAQVSSPSGYTSNYGFRKYAESATPSADSLNANWDDVDTEIKVAVDSAISTSTHWDRTFNGDIAHSGDFTITNGVTPDARGEFGVTSASPYYPTYYGTSVDTLTTRAFVRASIITSESSIPTEYVRTLYNDVDWQPISSTDSLLWNFIDATQTSTESQAMFIRFAYNKRANDDSLAISFEAMVDTVGSPDPVVLVRFGTIGKGTGWGSVASGDKVTSGSLWSGTENAWDATIIYLDVSGWSDGLYPMGYWMSGTPDTDGTLEFYTRYVNIDVIGHF